MAVSEIESYSPRIVSTLLIGQSRINVRELSSESIIVEATEQLGPCGGRIETLVGEDMDAIDVWLPEGIDPSRLDQPIRIIEDGE